METLKTYKFYDKDGRRLAIFGKYVPNHPHGGNPTLHITVIPCSRKDQFSVKVANQMYNAIDSGMIIGEVPVHSYFSVPVLDGKHKAEFLKFCNINYYKMVIGSHPLVYSCDILLSAKPKSSAGKVFQYVETVILKKKVYHDNVKFPPTDY